MNPEATLAELGLTVPVVVPPLAAYVPAIRAGNHIHTSGQLPMRDGQLLTTGEVGSKVSVDEAYECARQCALNAIAAIKAEVGDLSKVRRIVKVVVFITCAAGFDGLSTVADGASELLGEAFGEAGVHARTAVGVSALPLGSPVELEILVEL